VTVGEVEPARDALEQALVEEAIAQNKPLLGICRGIQILNVALGGTLVVDIPTEVPGALDHRRADRKTEPVHDVELAAGSTIAEIAGTRTLSVNSTHHQAVGRVADPLRAVAVSPDGVVEGIEWKERRGPFLLAVQWHPERLLPTHAASARLFARFTGVCAGG
jgi:putative glutamine amidotransferase